MEVASQAVKPLKPMLWLLFGSRWLQLPLYLGLIAAQGVYVVQFMRELLHLPGEVGAFNETTIMLAVLAAADRVMPAAPQHDNH